MTFIIIISIIIFVLPSNGFNNVIITRKALYNAFALVAVTKGQGHK